MWRRIRKPVGIGAVALLAVLIAIQFVPVDRSNPPVTMDVVAPTRVRVVLRQSCYDCHSNEVKWPWYSYVAPVSWLVAKDVREGREHLNFSTWDRYTTGERSAFASEAYEEAAEGEMPLPIYLTMHGDARPTEDDMRILREWADATANARSTHLGGGAEGRDED